MKLLETASENDIASVNKQWNKEMNDHDLRELHTMITGANKVPMVMASNQWCTSGNNINPLAGMLTNAISSHRHLIVLTHSLTNATMIATSDHCVTIASMCDHYVELSSQLLCSGHHWYHWLWGHWAHWDKKYNEWVNIWNSWFIGHSVSGQWIEIATTNIEWYALYLVTVTWNKATTTTTTSRLFVFLASLWSS